MVKIICKKTGEVYDAVENFTEQSYHTFHEAVYGEITEEQFIKNHNEYAESLNNMNLKTKCKLWDDTSEEEKVRLMKARFNSIVDYKEILVPKGQFLNGYFVISETGGNMNKGWVKLFSPNMVEILDA